MSLMQYKVIAGLVLAVIVLLIMRSLTARDRKRTSLINLEDLLLGEDGKLSKAAVVLLGAFLFTTWMMAYLTLAGKMTEGYAGIYVAAWVTPAVALIFKANPPAPPPT